MLLNDCTLKTFISSDSWRTCTRFSQTPQTYAILIMLEKDIRLLNKTIRKGENGEVPYTDEELRYLKKKRNQLRNWKQSAKTSQNNGFGQYVE